MKRIALAVAVLLLAVCTPVKSQPDVPKGAGYCVSVYEADGRLIDLEFVPTHRPDPEKLGEFISSLKSAVWHVGQRNGRQDIVQASADVVLVPTLQDVRRKGDSPTAGACRTICSCATMICSSGMASCAPEDIIGCGGACGSCEKCVVSCPPATGKK